MIVRFHKDDEELLQILQLQQKNDRSIISQAEFQKEGFLTLQHTIDDLKNICGNNGHTVAIYEDVVIGYALTMLSNHHRQIPALGEMINKIEQLKGETSFLVMGQVCVDKLWRGHGVFGLMYNHIKHQFEERYHGIYTEIDEENPRSIRAHEKVGFKTVTKYKNSVGKTWYLVYWKWN